MKPLVLSTKKPFLFISLARKNVGDMLVKTLIVGEKRHIRETLFYPSTTLARVSTFTFAAPPLFSTLLHSFAVAPVV